MRVFRPLFLPIVWDRLRCSFAHFKLRAHSLQARTKRFNLLLLMRGSRLEGHCSRYEEESAAIALGRKRDLLLMTYGVLRQPSRQGGRQVVDEIERLGAAKPGCQIKAGRGRHARNPRAKVAVIVERYRTRAKGLRNNVEKVA